MKPVLIVFYLVFSKATTALGNRLKRLETRIDRVEKKQDLDSLSRREDIADLTRRVDVMETWLNTSLTGQSSSEFEISSESGKKLDSFENVLLTVTTAFADEKARFRRQASEMENSIKGVKQEVRNAMDVLDAFKDIVLDTVANCSQNNQPSAVVIDKLDKIEKMIEGYISSSKDVKQTYSSCLEIYRTGVHVSGAYDIYPTADTKPIRVYCDMDTDGGGWTVFQRREDGSEDFYRYWDDYAFGFGDVEGEFWLGNEHISTLTSECCHELRIDLEDFEGNSAFAKYNRFQVLPRVNKYKLVVASYSGNASDSLISVHSNQAFTTRDRDNDGSTFSNCAQAFTGAWWYSGCHASNLNGLYLNGENESPGKGIVWYYWKNTNKYSLKRTEMKFRVI